MEYSTSGNRDVVCDLEGGNIYAWYGYMRDINRFKE
jgi:hypothetical protein